MLAATVYSSRLSIRCKSGACPSIDYSWIKRPAAGSISDSTKDFKRFLSVSLTRSKFQKPNYDGSATLSSKLGHFQKDFIQRRSIGIMGPGVGTSNFRGAATELAKEEGAVNASTQAAVSTVDSQTVIPSSSVNDTLKALENVVMDRDGTPISTNYSIWQFFDDYVTGPVINALDVVHQSGIPYWGVIVGSALAVRIVVLPLTIKAMRAAGELGKFMPKNTEFLQKINDAKQRNNPVLLARLQDEWTQYHTQSKVGPFTPMKYALFQTPIFMGFYFSIKRMVETHPDMINGGALWFHNLAAADPYYRLPTIAAVALLLNFEYLNDVKMPPSQHKIMRGVMIAMSVAAMYFTRDFAMGIHLYWAASMLFTMLVSAIIRKTSLREILKIPMPASPSASAVGGSTTASAPAFKTIKDEVTYAHKPKKQKTAVVMNPTNLADKMNKV
eukprot:TRINITY_DN8191_c0_g1_i1.p1 TRINITY_DN8191_c0_g1~~TRINITY_DN8191_c0_g1_i1.p1  ORF type:complete len:443 (+),score=58.33 TRINITY_DN8191_c0_g1_i1:86-1414(+)